MAARTELPWKLLPVPVLVPVLVPMLVLVLVLVRMTRRAQARLA
jgi:hypothetical protein